MASKWKTTQEKLKEMGLVRMHFDIPLELRTKLRIAAAQDSKRLKEVYTDALVEYVNDRQLQREARRKKNNKLTLDLEGLD